VEKGRESAPIQERRLTREEKKLPCKKKSRGLREGPRGRVGKGGKEKKPEVTWEKKMAKALLPATCHGLQGELGGGAKGETTGSEPRGKRKHGKGTWTGLWRNSRPGNR